MARNLTPNMELTQYRYGKPLEEVFQDLWEKHGSVAGMAVELGLTRHGVYYWLSELGLTAEDLRRASGERKQASGHRES